MGHDIRGNVGDGNAHVSIVSGLHGGSQVKILDVTHHAMSSGGGHHTVEEEFGSGEVSSFGADIARIFNAITTNSPVDTVWDRFFRVMCANNVQVSGTAPRWDCGDWDEEHGVGPRDGSHTLHQAMDLSDVGLLPQGTIGAVAEFGIFSGCTCVRVEGIAMVSSVPQVTRWE